LSPEGRDHRLTEIVRDLDRHVSESSPGGMSELSQSYEADRESEHEELPYGKPTDFSVGEHGTVRWSFNCSSKAWIDLCIL
jgi:hypothetical protein